MKTAGEEEQPFAVHHMSRPFNLNHATDGFLNVAYFRSRIANLVVRVSSPVVTHSDLTPATRYYSTSILLRAKDSWKGHKQFNYAAAPNVYATHGMRAIRIARRLARCIGIRKEFGLLCNEYNQQLYNGTLFINEDRLPNLQGRVKTCVFCNSCIYEHEAFEPTACYYCLLLESNQLSETFRW